MKEPSPVLTFLAFGDCCPGPVGICGEAVDGNDAFETDIVQLLYAYAERMEVFGVERLWHLLCLDLRVICWTVPFFQTQAFPT